MLSATWNREVSLHSHIFCKDIKYTFLFSPFFLKIRNFILFSGITVVERMPFEVLR